MNPKSTNKSAAVSIDGAARKFTKAGPLAARLGVCKKTIIRWGEAGKISRFKVNERVLLFDEAEVFAFIESARLGALPQP